MKLLKPFTIATATALTILAFTSVQADKLEYEILQVPEESPGPPWYADFGRTFIPTDGEWVSIVFWREPTSVPEDFNLLDLFDIPAAFSAPLLLQGEEWWGEEAPPLRSLMTNIDIVPVYFVKLEELEDEIEDDILTLDELEAFSSIRVGYADHVRYDIRIEYRSGRANDRARYTASGIMEDGGRFQVRLFEEADRETGTSEVDAVIRFPGSRSIKSNR
jgi:hypothetical protein